MGHSVVEGRAEAIAGAGSKLSTLLARADEVIEWPCKGHVVCCGA